MTSLFFDFNITEDQRRHHLYNGDLFVYSPCPSSLAMCAFAREMVEEAFAGLDPREAQHHLPVEEYAAILATLKPKFIHHSQSKKFIQGI